MIATGRDPRIRQATGAHGVRREGGMIMLTREQLTDDQWTQKP